MDNKEQLTIKELGCNIQFPYFGARYPDACCIEGNLMDMDKCDENGLLYSTEEDNPCPICRREEFIQNQLDSEYTLESIEKYIENIKDRYVKAQKS